MQSAKYHDYEIEVWTSEGRRITGFRGPALNATPVRAGRLTPENPPPNKIFAMRVQEPALLWVVSWQRKGEWRKSMVEKVGPGGRVTLDMKDGAPYERMFSSRIEVIDLNTASIIATREGDEMFANFLDADLVFGDHHREDGTPQVGIWRVVLRLPNGGVR